MISIINYGLGNLGSISNMLRYIGQPSQIINRPDELASVDKMILPGVGAFDAGMSQLKEKGWIEPLTNLVHEKKIPALGICLGMQLMTKNSEEGEMEGLGWVDATTKKFRFEAPVNLKVPHMGWSDVQVSNTSPLFPDMDEENRFYFVHSYYVEVENASDNAVTANYGHDFTAGFHSDNIYGMQFHPEKSHKFGMRFLERFATL